MSDNGPIMYALLVGIDDYASPSVPDLGGCVNDVKEMERLLHENFNVPVGDIKTLTDSEATHAAIKQAFRDHLIRRAQAWVEAGRPGTPPAFLFQYSGHGAQSLDETGTEPDGMDETIVPHDSRTPGVYDIKDWELGQLLDELNQYTENVTVILDCCHSGSGTRVVKDSIVQIRRCEPDLRPQPTHRPTGGATTRAVSGPSGWNLGEKYVLLAGCRDREEANEHFAMEDKYGAMTYFLVKELSQMSPDRPLTYRELHQRVSYQVNDLYKAQMPQCEGDRGREVFGGLRPTRDVFLSVVDKSEGYIWVDGGMVHGLTEGSELKVYPAHVRTLAEAGDPIATLEVEQVGAVRSGCRVTDRQQDIPIHARAVVYALNLGDMQRKVVLDIDIPDSPALPGQLENRLTQSDVEPYLLLVLPGTHADFRVEAADGQLQIQDNTGTLLVAPYALDDLDGVARDLAHLARYKNALELHNTTDSELGNAISLVVKKLDFDSNTQDPIALPIEPTAGGETIAEPGQRIVIEVTNHSDIPLNVALLDFSYDWSVTQLYPRMRGAHEQIDPDSTISLGLSRNSRDQLRPRLPAEVNEVPQIIKAIATVADTDFSVLEQAALKMPFTKSAARRGTETVLSKLLDLAMSGGKKRALFYDAPETEDEWTTAQLEFRIVHPIDGEQTTRALRGGTTTTLPAYQIEIEAPEGFQGDVRVLTVRQSTRAVGGDPTDLKPPAGLAGLGDLIEPVSVQSTRATAPTGAVIEIDADDFARRQVTEDTPLKIHLPEAMIADGESLMALAYDGNVFYPVGRPGEKANTLNVEWLPDTCTDDHIGLPPLPLRSTRSLGHTVKLFLYKLFSQSDPSEGLHRARFVPQEDLNTETTEPGERIYRMRGGEVRYRAPRDGELQTGQRVGLFVHGFGSETAWMVAGPAQFLLENGVKYDHILTFDYESVNTTVGTNSQNLANALKEAGFGPDDGITLDVFAHSMGALICRSMIEMLEGDTFVDRCILAGPPNEGTILVEAKKLVPLLGTLVTNLAGPHPASLLVGWVLKKVADEAKSLDDLRPGSELLSQLNGSTKEAKVPHYILAGRNELPPDGETFWKRLYLATAKLSDAALDMFFSDQHDMVISVNSMSTIRNGTYPPELLKIQVVPCHHFAYLDPAYFEDENSREPLLEWLGTA